MSRSSELSKDAHHADWHRSNSYTLAQLARLRTQPATLCGPNAYDRQRERWLLPFRISGPKHRHARRVMRTASESTNLKIPTTAYSLRLYLTPNLRSASSSYQMIGRLEFARRCSPAPRPIDPATPVAAYAGVGLLRVLYMSGEAS